MFGRITLWSYLVLDFCLLKVFFLIMNSTSLVINEVDSSDQCVQIAYFFLIQSPKIMFLEICSFFLGFGV